MIVNRLVKPRELGRGPTQSTWMWEEPLVGDGDGLDLCWAFLSSGEGGTMVDEAPESTRKFRLEISSRTNKLTPLISPTARFTDGRPARFLRLGPRYRVVCTSLP